MAESPEPDAPPLLAHGAEHLSLVTVETYNAELRTADGFIGDRASRRAFQAILDDWRERLRKVGDDPLGESPSEQISKKRLDKLLADGDAEAAGVIQGAIEEFSQEFAAVIRRFLRLKCWKDTERIAVGGGLRQSRIGELAIGRTAVALKADGHKSFNLPRLLREAIPQIGGHDTVVVMHNDAVVQGLSELPFMQDVDHWGVLTIGTGLGNACFTNRKGDAARK